MELKKDEEMPFEPDQEEIKYFNYNSNDAKQNRPEDYEDATFFKLFNKNCLKSAQTYCNYLKQDLKNLENV